MIKLPRKWSDLPEILRSEDIASALKLSLLFIIGFNVLGLINTLQSGESGWASVLRSSVLLFAMAVTALLLINQKKILLATYFVLISIGAILAYTAWTGAGVNGIAYAALILPVLAAALFLGRRAGYITASIAAAIGLLLFVAGRAGWLQNLDRPVTDVVAWLANVVFFFMAAHQIGISLRQVERALVKAHDEIDVRAHAEDKVRRLNAELEQRILERTAQLAAMNTQFQIELVERRRAEEKFRSMLESAPDAMVIVDKSGRIIIVNSQAEKLFGYQREELLNQLVEILIPNRYHHYHSEHRTSFFLQPRVRPMGKELELYGLRKNGSEFPLEISLSPLNIENEILVIAAVRDTSERKQAEAKFRGLLESAPDAMVIVDANSEIVMVNSQVEQVFGYQREELINQPLEILIPESYHVSHSKLVSDYFLQPQARHSIKGKELYGVRMDGNVFPADISLSPLDTEQGILVTAAIRDITERKLAEAELEAALRRVEALYAVTRVGLLSTNLPVLLQEIVECVAQGMPANRATLITFDQQSQEVKNFVRGGPGADYTVLTVSYDELADGLSGWAIRTRQSALSPKDMPDPRESAEVRQRRKETNCGSILVTPLLDQDHILGTLTVINLPEEPNFTNKDVVLLEAIASQAATAIIKVALYGSLQRANQGLSDRTVELEKEITERKRAEQQLAHRAAQLAVLHQLGHDIVASLELEQVCASTHRAVEQLMPTEAFFISLLNEERQEIENTYLFDMGQRWTNESYSLTTPGLTSYVFRTGETLFIKDDANGTSLAIGRTLFGTPEETRSVIIAPLKLSGKVIGAISAQHYQPNMYTADHVQIFEMLANQVAIAIQNARLFTERATFVKELEAKNAELDRFTHTVSHDLKSPLVTLRGFLYYLEKDIQSGNQENLQQDIERINQSAEKMQRLITELLELSQIGRLINPPMDISFADIVQDALSRVEGRLAARQIKVEIRGELPHVYGDRNRLVQVMQNLLDNAAKFMGNESKPHIEIGIRTQAEKIIFYVKDNGVGIDPEVQEKVFGLFDKLDAQSDGTGIGLALVKRIIEVHGGQIWVESEGEGKGCTFCFTLK